MATAHRRKLPHPPIARVEPLVAAPSKVVAKHNILRNLLAGGGASLFKVVLQLAMLPIMGRLLGPTEFGLYATALPLVSFFAVIADGGLGVSLAKEDGARSIVWSTAFYVMLGVAVLLTAVLNLCGLILAKAMGEPRLFELMTILSISFLFIGVSVLPAARLVRRNDLVSGSVVDVLATIVGAGIAIASARAGFGALSLAFQFVGAYGIRAVGLNALAFERPTFEFSLSSLAHHTSTGGVLVGGRMLDLFCRFAENLLFSVMFGPAALGAYTFANQVSRFLCEAASNPIWSALYAQAIREQKNALAPLLLNMARLMLIATFFAACLIAAAAPQLLQETLGSKWVHAGPLLQMLVPSYSIASTASLGGAILLATGHNRPFLATFAVLSVGRAMSVSLGHWTGPLGAGLAVSSINLVYAATMILVCHQIIGIGRADLFARLLGPIGAALCAGVTCFLTLAVLPRSFVGTSIAMVSGAAAFLAIGYLMEGRTVIADLTRLRRLTP